MPNVYRMDRVTGRIVGSSSRLGYNPQAFTAVEATTIMKSTAAERAAPVRGISDMRTPVQPQMTISQSEIHGQFPDTATFRRLQEWQRIMGRQDGKLVWQKRPRDRPAYLFTLAVCALGVAIFTKNMYSMAYKTSEE